MPIYIIIDEKVKNFLVKKTSCTREILKINQVLDFRYFAKIKKFLSEIHFRNKASVTALQHQICSYFGPGASQVATKNFHFWRIIAQWARLLPGYPILSCQTGAHTVKGVGPEKGTYRAPSKCWSLLFWKIGYTLKLPGSTQKQATLYT